MNADLIHRRSELSFRRRGFVICALMAGLFFSITAQLVRLSLADRSELRISLAEPIGGVFSRPDITDRHGHLIAADVAAPSLYADPALILDLDEVVEKLTRLFPELDMAALRRTLADRSRRFAWIKRGLTPLEAQAVHDLGLPALGFRQEPKRVYPSGSLFGHVVGQVDIDNKGVSGLERYIDETVGVEPVQAPRRSSYAPLRLSLDLGAQHAVSDELKDAVSRYSAAGAAGLVMDVATGELIAAVSLPELDANRPADALWGERLDKLASSVFELGSMFKTLTVAMALEERVATLDKVYDVRRPLRIGAHTINDLHAVGRPLSVRDIFVRSSNIGAALIALEAGSERQLGFLSRLGLLSPIRTEAGPVAAPLLPKRWGEIETVTIAYGHGLAVAPVQFATAVAMLVNGGKRVAPTFLASTEAPPPEQIVSAATSAHMREILRLNVKAPYGTGRRAEVAGYEVGGKTGTAEMPGKGGYQKKAVIASFIAILPSDAPKYLVLVSIFEPKATEETKGHITAGLNAAPVTGRLITRIAPILGLLPDARASQFDVSDAAKYEANRAEVAEGRAP